MTRTMYALLSALLLSLTPTICAAQDEPKAAETPAAPAPGVGTKEALTAAPKKQEVPGAACGFDKLPGIPVVIQSAKLPYGWEDADLKSVDGVALPDVKAVISPKLVFKQGEACPSYNTTCRRKEGKYIEMTTEKCQTFYVEHVVSGNESEAVTTRILNTYHRELRVLFPDGLADTPVTALLSDLRSRDGVCVGGDTLSAPAEKDMGSDVTLTVCFRIGKAGSADDDKKPRSWVQMEGSKHMVWAGAWIVNIKHNGKDWLKSARPQTTPTLDDCSQYGCSYYNYPFLTQNKAFKPGTYDITLTYADNTKRQHKFRIVLLDDKKPKGDEKKPKDGKKK